MLVVTLALTAGCTLPKWSDVLGGVIHPTIAPSPSERGTRVVERTFPFEGSMVTLRVPVDSAVYAGAVGADKRAVFLNGERPPDWVSDYYRAFIDEEHQESFYVALIDALHVARDELGLDSSRYIELVTSMVQDLEYRVDPGDLAPKFPIATFTDGYGDCDDKTLLCAAILSREGYDVAVLFFAPEKHVAMGVRAPGLAHQHTSYAYVEMTEPSLVGIPPDTLAGDIEIESRPDVIRIGTGADEYGAGDQIELIATRLREIKREIARLGKQISRNNDDLAARRAEIEDERRALQTSTGVTEDQVQRLNERVAAYNALVAASNDAVSAHNSLVELQRFAIEHPTERTEVYRRMKAARL